MTDKIQARWVIVASNGRFEVSKAQGRKILKSDRRNSFAWKGLVCEILLWSADPFITDDIKGRVS